MSPERISYRNLPLAVRNRIEDLTGVVLSDASVGEGLNSSVAALLHTRQGRYLIKALPADHRWVWTQEREAKIAQHVRPVAPALRARIADHGWDVLVFEALEGHQAGGLTAFAQANTRMWSEVGGGNPDAWTRRLIIAADTWHEFRTVPRDGFP